MKTLWQDEARAECMARARKLTPDSQRLWGKMSVDQVLAHMVDAFRMGLGELEVRPKKLPIRFWPINYIICNWVPFPRNTPTACLSVETLLLRTMSSGGASSMFMPLQACRLRFR